MKIKIVIFVPNILILFKTLHFWSHSPHGLDNAELNHWLIAKYNYFGPLFEFWRLGSFVEWDWDSNLSFCKWTVCVNLLTRYSWSKYQTSRSLSSSSKGTANELEMSNWNKVWSSEWFLLDIWAWFWTMLWNLSDFKDQLAQQNFRISWKINYNKAFLVNYFLKPN